MVSVREEKDGRVVITTDTDIQMISSDMGAMSFIYLNAHDLDRLSAQLNSVLVDRGIRNAP